MNNTANNKLLIKNRACGVLFSYLNSIKDTKFAMPANVCSVVPLTFIKAKKSFKIVDINKNTFSINLDYVENLIKSGEIGGIYYVNPYGAIVEDDIKKIKEIKKLYPYIKVINDKCLCIPKFGDDLFIFDEDLVLFSTGYSKVVDIGFGGYGYIRIQDPISNVYIDYDFNEEKLMSKQINDSMQNNKKFENFNLKWLNAEDYKSDFEEYKKKVLKELEDSISLKYKFNNIYEYAIPEEYRLPSNYNYWRFNIITNYSKEIINKLFKEKLFASAHYQSVGEVFGQGEFVNAEYVGKHILNLFNDKNVNIDMVKRTAEIVANYL